MRFYWVQDRVKQKQFHVYWKPGKQNLADYVTKHHPAHHQDMRAKFLHEINMLYNSLKQHMSNVWTHCKGVLIPNPSKDLAIRDQRVTNPGTTDGRTTDRQASRASQSNHKRVYSPAQLEA